MRSWLPLSILTSLASSYPTTSHHPLSFSCETSYQNNHLSSNAEECKAACESRCQRVGNGNDLLSCLSTLRLLGYEDCIFGFRQTIRVDPRSVCTRYLSDGEETIVELLLTMEPFVNKTFIPRTAQAKAVIVTITLEDDACPSIEQAGNTTADEAMENMFKLSWASGSAVDVSAERPDQNWITISVDKSPPSQGSNAKSCDQIIAALIYETVATPISAQGTQYHSKDNLLTLDLLEWGYLNWDEIGAKESTLIIRSSTGDCSLSNANVKAVNVGLSQVATIKVNQSSSLSNFVATCVLVILVVLVVL
eukprot:Blabericola_migrator_1__6146@NODE_30_length_19081_cov_136_854686_g26_i0_p8_GENE_NODE_30_length_19081_cov_136_854686_g26_i0NODE_30_length_19081_cov_136_854686_g26_i0_p8_ORF_typecomplete_len307_score23_95_NODE_30_length_19081_cov_136_854686_g26_i01250513425